MIVNGSLQVGRRTTAQIAAANNIFPLAGQIVVNTDDGKYCIGDGVTALSALTFYGGAGGGGLTIGTTTITSGTDTRILYNNAGVVGEYLVTGTGTTAVLSTSPTFTTDITTPLIIGGSGVNTLLTFQNTTGTTTSAGAAYVFKAGSLGADLLTLNQRNFIFSPYDTTGSAITNFAFTTATNTNQTLSTNIPNFRVTGSTKQWATGALATQYFNYFSANTVSFVGASTASEVYGMYVEAAIQGTNATITNNFALGLSHGTGTVKIGNLTGSTSASAIYLNKPSPSSVNYSLRGIGAYTYLNDDTGVRIQVAGLDRIVVDSGALAFSTAGASSGTSIAFTFTPATYSNQTLSTNIPNFRVTGSTKQWATGALALQEFNTFTSNTISFVGASTTTLAANLSVAYVQGGTNATITTSAAIYVPTLALTNTTTAYGIYAVASTGATNNYAAGFAGGSGVFLSDINLVLGTTTGTKIGTATTQKLSFWNATPIVQPTTAVAAATYSHVASTAVHTDSTFDGYTLQQVVKAIRNIGLLA